MSSRDSQEAPDVDRLARSMLLLHGAHDDDDHPHGGNEPGGGTWSKAPDFASDPDRAAAVAGDPSGTLGALPELGTGDRRLPGLAMCRLSVRSWVPRTRRSSGTPKRQGAALSSPTRSASPAVSRPARDPARSCPTATSSTP